MIASRHKIVASQGKSMLYYMVRVEKKPDRQKEIGMKCQRCGSEALIEEGHQIKEATGPDATQTLRFKGLYGTLKATVCSGCAMMLRRLGWQ